MVKVPEVLLGYAEQKLPRGDLNSLPDQVSYEMRHRSYKKI